MNNYDQLAEITVSYRPAVSNKPVIKSSLDAFAAIQGYFDNNTLALQEQTVVIYFNQAGRLLGGYKLTTGVLPER